jgi:hypothetical protein
MAKLGIMPGKPFELSKLDPAVQKALKDLPQTALTKIEANKVPRGNQDDSGASIRMRERIASP